MQEPYFLYDQIREERDKIFNEINKTLTKKHSYNINAIVLKKLTLALIRASGKKILSEKPLEKKAVLKPINQQPIFIPSTKLYINEAPTPTKEITIKKFNKKIPLQVPKPLFKQKTEIKEEIELPKPEIKAEKFREEYSIIISKTFKTILAKVMIDFRENNLIYNLVEPELNSTDQIILNEIKQDILKRKKFKLIDDENYLDKNLNKLTKKYNIQLINNYKEKIVYYLKRDLIGLGKIEPLLKDSNVKAIFCNGVNKLITINYKDYDNVKTNIVFTDEEELNSLVRKFGKEVNIELNEQDPILDSTLPNGVRVQATFGSSFVTSKFVIKR